jgi:Chalcone isomerase-like
MNLMRRATLTNLVAVASLAAFAAGTALPLAATAQTVEAGGARFEPTADVVGQKLVLNGVGVRYRAVFKVYAAGLYLKSKSNDADAIQKMDGPKRVTLKLLRDVDGKDLGRAFTDGMEKNLHPDERMRTINGIFKFGQVFADLKKAPSGTLVHIDWMPGVGTQVIFDGKPAGELIKEPEFYNSLLRIWLGEKPADDALKAALLGEMKKGR